MPIYEYECLECGEHFEQLQRFGGPAPKACPQGHTRIQRLFSQPAIIFKGPGFYVTDNRRNGSRSTSSRTSKDKKQKEKESASAASASADKKKA